MSVQTEPQEATAPKAGGRLPLAVYLLAFSLFAMGSAEFLLAGVLPDIADDLDISLSSAGALISAFAIGVVIGGPPLAVLTLRWPRRTTLVTSQAVFAAGVAVGLLTDDFTVLLVTRFLIGLAYAGFWAVAAVTAISLVNSWRRAGISDRPMERFSGKNGVDESTLGSTSSIRNSIAPFLGNTLGMPMRP